MDFFVEINNVELELLLKVGLWSKLVDHSITIYEAVQHIIYGKYVMPAFQRQFVWSTSQIEKLWDR